MSVKFSELFVPKAADIKLEVCLQLEKRTQSIGKQRGKV